MNKVLAPLRKVINFLNAAALKLSMVMLMAMLTIITIHVIRRYILGDSFAWSEEVCRFMMIWISFLLLPLAQAKGQNIAIDFIVSKFRYTRMGIIGAILVELMVIVVLYYCLIYGWQAMMRAQITFSEALEIPMFYVYMVLPYSFGLTLIVCFERLIELFTCLPNPESLRQCDEIRSADTMEGHA